MGRIGSKRKEWIAALESGRYRQTKEFLAGQSEKNKTAYCCLGVACRVAGLSIKDINGTSNVCDLPHKDRDDFRKQFNTDEQIELALAALNDQRGYTFKQIANLLKRGNKAVIEADRKVA